MLSVEETHLDQITRAISQLLKGAPAGKVELPDGYPENELKQVADYLNRFIDEHADFASALQTLSQGDLDFEAPHGGLQVLHSLKNLQGNMRHLTWKTQQIAAGDLDHRVDFMGDFSAAFNTMTQQLQDAFRKIEQQNVQLAHAYDEIRIEQEKSERLLHNILPQKVAEELKQTGATTPQAFSDVTVLFSDIVGFARRSSGIDPAHLISELNELFTAFDEAMEAHGCERIKTIGDAYLAVCGMPKPSKRHAEQMVDAALEMVDYVARRNAAEKYDWPIRTGIHTGRVVGGVVGVKKYIYDVFGDTINTASRMEACAAPMRINVSETTHQLTKDKFEFEEHRTVEVKGKGMMKMYYVNRWKSRP